MQFSNPGSLPSVITVSGGTINTVTNPVNVNPSFFWPQISGQNYPPALQTATYSSYLGNPCITSTSGTTGVNGAAKFPNIPRGNTITITGQFSMALDTSRALSVNNVITLGGSANSGFGIQAAYGPNLSGQCTVTWNVVNNNVTGATMGSDTYSMGTSLETPWIPFTMVINPDGSATFTVNGHTVNIAAGSIPTTANIAIAALLVGDTFHSGGNIGPLTVTYS